MAKVINNVREKLARAITMSVDLPQISEEFIAELTRIIRSSAGQCRLNFIVGKKDENIAVEMQSRKYKVELTDRFIQTIESLPGVNYKLN